MCSGCRPVDARMNSAVDRLLRASTAPDVARCDQDDFWRTDRLKTRLALLQKAATSFLNGTKQPLLLNSNAELIDGNGIIVQGAYGPDNAAQTTRINGIGPKQHCHELHDACQPRTLKPCTPNFRGCYLTRPLACACRSHNDGHLKCPQQLIAHRRHARNSSDLTSHFKQTPGHAFETFKAHCIYSQEATFIDANEECSRKISRRLNLFRRNQNLKSVFKFHHTLIH